MVGEGFSSSKISSFLQKLSGQLSEQEQRNAEAQLEIKTSNAKIETLEVEIKNLRNQLDAQHGIDEQVDAVHKDLLFIIFKLLLEFRSIFFFFFLLI